MTKEEIYKEFQSMGIAKRNSLDIMDAPYSREEAEAYQEGWRAAWSWAFDILGDIVTEPEKDAPVGHIIHLGAVEHIRKDALMALLEAEKEETSIGLSEYDAGHENGRMEVIMSLTEKIKAL